MTKKTWSLLIAVAFTAACATQEAPKPAPTLNSEYLLFSADLTAPASRAGRLPESFFRDLATRMPHVCHSLWGECRGCPDPRTNPKAFVEYLSASRIDIGLYYAGFPNLTGDDIAAAVNLREQLAQFALEHQDEMLAAAGTADFMRAAIAATCGAAADVP